MLPLCFFLPKIEFSFDFWLMKALYTSWHPCRSYWYSRGQYRSTSQDKNTGLPLGSPWNDVRQGQLEEDLSNLGSYELRRYSKYQVIEYLKLWKTREILTMLMFRNFIFDAHKQEYTLFLTTVDPGFSYFVLLMIHPYFYWKSKSDEF